MSYRTSEIAQKIGVHPNTVRFYERMEYISPVAREGNGYRKFNKKHLNEMKILRCIFVGDWPGKNIRNASLIIIEAVKSGQLELAKSQTKEYVRLINLEYLKAIEAIEILKNWCNRTDKREVTSTYNRREAAAIIGVTAEALRNWERNGLILTNRVGKNRMYSYDMNDMARLKVIYMLRQSRFSMSAIQRCLIKIDKGSNEEGIRTLNAPNEIDILSTGDQWLNVIKKVSGAAKDITFILDEIEV